MIRSKELSSAAPGATALNPFVRRVAELIEMSEKTQRQIARELGYEKPNIVTMFKQGDTRVPLDKVRVFATSLETDPAALLRLWLATYEPEALAVIDQTFDTSLTANERAWLAGIRRAFADNVPNFNDDARRQLELLARLRQASNH